MLTTIDIHNKLAAGNRPAAAWMRGFGSDLQAMSDSALAVRYAR